MKHLRAIVTGGRTYNNYATVSRVLSQLNTNARKNGYKLVISQGGAKGADYLAKVWCKSNQVRCREYRANWEKFGKSAGYVRNRRMLIHSRSKLVIAFPGGAGTQNMIDIAEALNIKVVKC